MPAKTFDDKRPQIIWEGERKRSDEARGKAWGTREERRGWRNVKGMDGQSVGGEQQGTICQDERFLWQLTT